MEERDYGGPASIFVHSGKEFAPLLDQGETRTRYGRQSLDYEHSIH